MLFVNFILYHNFRQYPIQRQKKKNYSQKSPYASSSGYSNSLYIGLVSSSFKHLVKSIRFQIRKPGKSWTPQLYTFSYKINRDNKTHLSQKFCLTQVGYYPK